MLIGFGCIGVAAASGTSGRNTKDVGGAILRANIVKMPTAGHQVCLSGGLDLGAESGCGCKPQHEEKQGQPFRGLRG